MRDTDIFEKTMIPHLDAAYNLARWMVRNEKDAEDMVQEAYLRAFRYFSGFTGGDGKAWLLTIVRNTCLTWLKSRRTPDPFDERLHSADLRQPAQESEMITQDRGAILRECMEALPEEYRTALTMRELGEMSYKSIAEATEQPIGTVMSRLSRARKRLGDCVASKGARA